MNENNELPDDIQSALRDVPPVSSDLRESHISAALSSMAAPKKRSIPYLGIAASFLVVFGVASTIATRKDNTLPVQATAHAIAVVNAPKNLTPDATIHGFPHSCFLEDVKTVAFYTMDTNPMQVDVTDTRVEFKNNNSCAVAAALNIPTENDETSKPVACTASLPENETLLATFDAKGVRYRVQASSTDLILFSCATNTEVARTNHPDYDNVID